MSPVEILAFEARWPRHSAAKSEAVRRELGISATRYYQLLIRAAGSPDGIRAHPITARLVRDRGAVRAARRRQRVA